MFEQLVNEAASRFGLPVARVSALLRALLQFIANEHTGGADGFIDHFRRAGGMDVISSWFDGREGTPLSESQLEAAIGSTALDRLAASSGLTRDAARSALAFMLPPVLSRLTPSGTLPSGSTLLTQARSIHVPTAVARTTESTTTQWLPWAAVVLLAIAGMLWLRGPTGTMDPQLTLTNRDGKVTYSGIVRDQATQAAIVDTLRRTFGAANVDGTLRVDPDVKRASWLSRLSDVVTVVRTPGAELWMSGDAASVGGWVSLATRQTLVEKVRDVLGSGTIVRTIADPTLAATRAANERALETLGAIGTSGVSADRVVEAMNLAVINFPTGSARIPADNEEVIRRSADALRHAPASTRVEIGGHTDGTGDPARNVALSRARAEAVKAALVDAGVPASMLVTRGFGDTKPIATNDTEYGRFQNRRIEYAVLALN